MNPWADVEPILMMPGETATLCARPYPGHPRGCPNFNRKPGCPRAAPRLPQVLNLAEPVWTIWNVFDLAGHIVRMKARHPEWSDRQLRCCLYWQPRARKSLRRHVAMFLYHHPGLHVVATPEAQGVNVTATMKSAGITLEWPPRNVAYQVVLAGTPLTPPPRVSTREGEGGP
ncbi:MAG TPA: hypothetical protein VMW52_03505 [Phycisphaerae bacterium]|nr:hypothetical protein [Phycisphaerae bacterium]